MFAGDVALVGRDQPFAARKLGDRGHSGVAVEGRAALPRALGQRLRQVGGLDIAVVGVLDRAEDAVGVTQRPDRLDLGGGEEADVDTERAGDAGIVAILVHPVGRRRQADVADLRKAGVEAGLRLQRGIEADRILVKLADRIAEVEQGQQAGGVPGRARGEFLALEEDAVGPAELRQVVQRADPHDAAADDHCPCCRFHVVLPAPVFPLRYVDWARRGNHVD